MLTQGLYGEKAVTVTCLTFQGLPGLLYQNLGHFPDIDSLRCSSAFFFS